MNSIPHGQTTNPLAGTRASHATPLNGRTAFTLVELLVVITIIGILASLIVVAVVGALKKAQETRIKAELDQISVALDEYKNKHTAYPPNAVTDAGTASGEPALDTTRILNDLKRHLRQVAPRNRESDDLLRVIAGLNPADTGSYPQKLAGGMSAGEALVFWLGGFSSDPKYPLSGEGGPSYEIPKFSDTQNRELEDLSARRWVFPFEVPRLAPRDDSEYFDESQGRFIEYMVTINGKLHIRRINFWQYLPAKSKQPYVYFDTSRYEPKVLDPPASADVHIHALKKIENLGSPTNERVEFVNPEKFQVLHCGIDDAWGEAFDHTSYHQYTEDKANNTSLFLAFPAGPFTGDVADTIVNFATQTRLEDAQPQ